MYYRKEAGSLAGLPKQLIETPDEPRRGKAVDEDVLSGVLRSIRLSGSLQFCFMPSGDWQTDGKPRFAKMAGRPVMPFHILVEGNCWLKLSDRRLDLTAGDIVAFPFATAHQIGHGDGGRLITPVEDLPPKPWREFQYSATTRPDRKSGCFAVTLSATPWIFVRCARHCRRCCI
jgi:Cupin